MANSKIAESISQAASADQIPGFSETGPSDAFWRRIERMLAEIAALAKLEPIPPDFPARVLVALHKMLPTPGGFFWTTDRQGRLQQSASYFPDEKHRNGI